MTCPAFPTADLLAIASRYIAGPPPAGSDPRAIEHWRSDVWSRATELLQEHPHCPPDARQMLTTIQRETAPGALGRVVDWSWLAA